MLMANPAIVLASLEAKYNAVKMLQSRLDFITSYLRAQPESYLTDPSLSPAQSSPHLSHDVLRSISTLASEIKLVTPKDLLDLAIERERAKTDDKLMELLLCMSQNAGNLQMLGKRVGFVESRSKKENRGALDMDQNPMSFSEM
jgi:COP9 signalosome complex subunit 6